MTPPATAEIRPRVSVVIPVYNRSHLLRLTIESVLAQTIDDYEVIVVDDGSKDDPAEVVSRIDDSRIRCIRQTNAGSNAARNLGIDHARGDFVAMLDSDDRFLPDHLAAALAKLNQQRALVVYGRIIVDRGTSGTFVKPPRPIRHGEHMAEYLLCDRGFVQTSTLVMPTELARRVRYLDGLPFGQDADFAIRLFNSGAAFHMLEQPTAVWRDIAEAGRVSSNSTSESFERWIEGIRRDVPARAYYGGRGWYLAKTHADAGRIGKAMTLFSSAVVRGCYSPRFAAVVLMQVALPKILYRRIADLYVTLRRPFRATR